MVQTKVGVMPIPKQKLREAAQMVLTNRGYGPLPVSGRGIVPGTRWRATKGPAAGQQIAVRTPVNREVGFVRRDDKAGWRTISNSKIPETLVAVPSLSDPESLIEVLCFDSKTMAAKFDAAVEKAHDRTLYRNAPVFVALDDIPQSDSGALTGGLSGKAKWREEISVDLVSAKPLDEFFERVKREFAERNGVNVSNVIVEFRIVA
jgi:hypothetical protein